MRNTLVRVTLWKRCKGFLEFPCGRRLNRQTERYSPFVAVPFRDTRQKTCLLRCPCEQAVRVEGTRQLVCKGRFICKGR